MGRESGTVNGLPGGDGLIDDWKSQTEQKGQSGISAPISIVDFSTLMNAPNTPNHNNFNLTERAGSGSISGLDYYISAYYQDSRIAPYIESLGLNLVPCESGDKFALPFGTYFQGITMSYGSVDACRLYSNNKYNEFMSDSVNYDWSGIGSSSAATRYDNLFFCWIGTSDGTTTYRGYFTYSVNDSGTVSQYAWCIWSIDKAINLLGTFTTGATPKPDPQKGIPSLPIGAAGDVVKKRIDEISMPDAPFLGVSTAGMIHLYRISSSDLNLFASEIFKIGSRRQYGGGDAMEYIGAALENIDKGLQDTLLGNLKDFVVDLHLLPCSPTTGSREHIKIGGYLVSSMAAPCNSDYIDVDCGSIQLSKDDSFYDSFQDLDGARYKLFLPFIGFVDVPPSYVWSHTLRVRYRFNVVDGSCMAFVSSSVLQNGNQSIIGVYSGSACVHMPITGTNYSSMISGMLQTASGLATSYATGNPLTGISGVLSGASNMTHPNITMSNGYNASTSFMGCRKPYLLIEKNTQNMPENFYKRNGGLCMTSYLLGDIKGSGFTKCANVDTNTFGNLKKHEKEELKRMLESGVYL